MLHSGNALKKDVWLHAVVLLLVLWAAFGLRLRNIDLHSLWYDELLELDIAQKPAAEISPHLIRHAAMPLDYYVQHFWTKFGRQELWVRFPALVFGLLTVAQGYRLARQLFNRRVGLLTALLLACSFFAVRYSQEARPYAMLTFCTTLAFWGLWQTHRRQQIRYWGVTIAAMTGAVLSHYFSIFLIAPMGLFVMTQLAINLKSRTPWLHVAAFGALLLTFFTVFLFTGRIWRLYSVGERFAREAGQPQLYTIPAHEKPNRGDGPPVTIEFFVEKVLQPLSSESLPVAGLFVALVLAAIIGSFRASPPHQAAVGLLLAWCLLPILLIYLFLLHRGTFYAIRYILFALPPFLLLTALGVYTVAQGGATRLARSARTIDHRPVYLYPAISLILLLPLVWAQFATLQAHYAAGAYEDWRAVGQFLHQNASPQDAVIAVNAEPAINWYYPPARQPFGTYSRSASIWTMLRQHPRRWFVLSSYSFKQDQGLRDWLTGQHAVKIVIDRRVAVYYLHQGQSRAEMLAAVMDFTLPQKPLTYQVLADQFEALGDGETSRMLYNKAAALTQASAPPLLYELTSAAALP